MGRSFQRRSQKDKKVLTWQESKEEKQPTKEERKS